jgi:uncharacterized protein YndB with AHSA1/START domain
VTVDGTSPHKVIFTKPSDVEFRVERVFDHPIERVWAAYTDPTLIPQWWGDQTRVDHMDVRVGGTWKFVSKAGEGQEFATVGEFLEVNPPTRLVQTFGMEGPFGGTHTQTIEFSPVGRETRLVLTSRFGTTEERDQVLAYGAEKGAISGLASLDRMLKRLAA